MEDFLSRLNIKPPTPFQQEGGYAGKEIRFKLGFEGNEPRLSTIDAKGCEVHADYRYYEGHTAQLLRSMDNVRREQVYQFSWDKDDKGISLKSHPYLLYPLAACKNIVDEHLNPVHISEGNAALQLLLRREDGLIHPSLQARVDDGHFREDFRLLSDSFLLAGDALYPLSPIGDNYTQLSVFIEPFREDQLESYLSIFCSFIENVQPVYP